jgi:hypothetical protein
VASFDSIEMEVARFKRFDPHRGIGNHHYRRTCHERRYHVLFQEETLNLARRSDNPEVNR